MARPRPYRPATLDGVRHPAGPAPTPDVWDLTMMEAAARKLVDSWRERAAALRPYSDPAAHAYETAARELETQLAVPERASTLRRIVRALRSDILTDIRALQREQGETG